MACSKYTLTNTGSTIINFNYRRCDDSLWEYQVELNPNQTKNIWLINNTYSIAPLYQSSVVLVNNGVFPPLYPTPTPTHTSTNSLINSDEPTPHKDDFYVITYTVLGGLLVGYMVGTT